MKKLFILLIFSLLVVGCKETVTYPEGTAGTNPPHGRRGHRCDLAVGAMLPNSHQRETQFKRGDVVYLHGRMAVIVDFGSATDWQIELVDCNHAVSDCYFHINETDLTKTP